MLVQLLTDQWNWDSFSYLRVFNGSHKIKRLFSHITLFPFCKRARLVKQISIQNFESFLKHLNDHYIPVILYFCILNSSGCKVKTDMIQRSVI